jgi:polyketide cyclase/dehydrase/lipid transport protein
MATVDQTFTVEAPPGVVFAYLTDREKATVWQASLLEAHFSPDAAVHKGTEIHEVRKLLGRKIESTVEVTEFEQDRLFGGRVRSGPVPWQFRYTFEGANGSTRVDFHMEGQPGGFFRVAEPLVVRTVEKQLENDFSTLKDLVETL